MTIVIEIKNHGYMTCVLSIVELTKQTEKIWLSMLLLTDILFRKNIQSDFTLRLVCKKNEITITSANYRSQFKLKYR